MAAITETDVACKNCRFYRQSIDPEKAEQGTCHISPPRADTQGIGYFPIVKENEFCGKFSNVNAPPRRR